MRLARTAGYTGLVLLGVSALAAPRLSFPADTGSWATLSLAGASITAMVGVDDGVLVAHDERLELVRPDGTTAELEVGTPVSSLAAEGGIAYAGTNDGVLEVPLDGDRPRRAGLRGHAVHSVDVRDGVLLAGTDRGLLRRAVDRSWSRLWPTGEGPGRSVPVVLSLGSNVLFVHDAAVYRLAAGRPARRTLKPETGQPVSLSPGARPGQVWAGLRQGPVLLESRDGGRTWTARHRGLGLSAVLDVVTDADSPEMLLAAGTGLADGIGNAGVQRSHDGGRTWLFEQDSLSNTNVADLVVREEPFALELDVTFAQLGQLRLPTWQERVYAATNGSGVSTARPDNLWAHRLAAAHPVLRTAEPLLLGFVVALALVPAYLRLTRVGPRAGVSAPTAHRNTDKENE